jgi:hypothetical protein
MGSVGAGAEAGAAIKPVPSINSSGSLSVVAGSTIGASVAARSSGSAGRAAGRARILCDASMPRDQQQGCCNVCLVYDMED